MGMVSMYMDIIISYSNKYHKLLIAYYMGTLNRKKRGETRSNARFQPICGVKVRASAAEGCMTPNPAVDPVRFALWTLRDEAVQRRLCQTFGVL